MPDISKVTTPIVESLKHQPVLLVLMIFIALVIGLLFYQQQQMREYMLTIYQQHGELTKLMFQCVTK